MFTFRSTIRSAGCACALAISSTAAAAAPVLRSADVHITVASPRACDVSLTLAVEGASSVEHRIEAVEGSRIALVDVRGARQESEVRTIGQTQALVLQPAGRDYGFRYRAEQPAAFASRCPIWLPTIPADGRSQAVHLEIDIPAGATAGAAMPTFTWSGTHGIATLGHLPALVRVSYDAAGDVPGRDIASLIDRLAMAIFALAIGVWAVGRARR